MPLAIVHSPQEWTARVGPDVRTALSVGTFDGLHLGHQRILGQVLARARAESLLASVVTFDPHPMRVLRPNRAPLMIQTLEQRLDGFARMGIDAALILRFDRALSLLSAEQFIEQILIARLRVAAVLVGENFCFGHRGAGNVQLLAQYGERCGFEVEIVTPVECAGRIVSSTNIRTSVAAGDVVGAAEFLGRPFALTGEIRAGAGRGRTILFPTLNLAPEQELLPKLGVYATESVLGDKAYLSVTNIGTRPTFNGQGISVESHLFDFCEAVTSGRMEVRFHRRLRDEQKFPGPDALRAQIAQDIAAAQIFFSHRKAAEPSFL